MLKQADQHHVKINMDCPEHMPHIDANSTLLQRALVNLYTNAIQAMPNGGTLSVKTHVNSKNESVYIEVADNGVGIPPEAMDKIFTPFFTTRSGRSGLGLAITYRIIDWHGGRISVVSQPESGTIFEIILPLKKASSYSN